MTGDKCLPAKAQVALASQSVAAGSIPLLNDGKPAVWSGYNELRVKFIYDQDVNQKNYDPNKVIEWANEWNKYGRDLSLPHFRLARPNEHAEIRVKLNGTVNLNNYFKFGAR